MEKALTWILDHTAPVTAIARGVWWDELPQAEPTPAIVLHVITQFPEAADEGEVGLLFTRVQIDCLADKRQTAVALARAVRTRLSGVKAEVNDGVEFQSILLDDTRDDTFTAAAADRRRRRSLDFLIWTTG